MNAQWRLTGTPVDGKIGAARSAQTAIDFLLLPNFSMLAFSCCVEPLRAANTLLGAHDYRWRLLSLDGAPVRASNGATVAPDDGLAALETSPAKLVFVCAGLGAERFRDAQLTRALRALARRRVTLGGVCTGALALARAGLLDGHRCTIHWENVEGFAEEFPQLAITATLFEIDRDRLTSSGGTAPLDLMINLIARHHGDDAAMQVAEFLLHQSVRTPDDAQRMSARQRMGITNPKLLAAIAQMEATVENPIALADLASAVCLSPRQLERLFREKLGKTPSRYYLQIRLERARLLLQQTEMAIIQVAVASGFTSASHFARCYREQFGKSPGAARRTTPRIDTHNEAYV